MNDSGKMPNEEIVRLRTVAFTVQEMAKEIVSRSDAEIASLREKLDKAEREKENARIWSTQIMDNAYSIIIRQEADLREVREQLRNADSVWCDVAMKHRDKAEAELTAAQELVKPLLDHYLECYEGNYDDLANAAVAFLERTNCNNS